MESTISMGVMVACLVACVLTTIVPIVVSVVLLVRKNLDRLAYLWGFLGFFLSQIVLRVPILSVLSTVSKGFSEFYNTLLGGILIGGLTAGLFEETARLIVGKCLLSKRGTLTLKDGISSGVGHALCEVVILVGITYISTLAVFIMINTNTFYGIMVNGGVKESEYTQYLELYTSTQAIDFFYGLVERCSAIVFHIANTLLVFRGVRQKRYSCYLLAIVLHTVCNSLALVLSTYTNVPITEGAVLVFSIVALAVQLRVGKE